MPLIKLLKYQYDIRYRKADFLSSVCKKLSFRLGHLPQLPAVLVHHVVLYRHVLCFPPRLVLLLGDVLVRVLRDEGVICGEENKQASYLSCFNRIFALILAAYGPVCRSWAEDQVPV